jgi:hypothetical protein
MLAVDGDGLRRIARRRSRTGRRFGECPPPYPAGR